jgi:hypothetical protein
MSKKAGGQHGEEDHQRHRRNRGMSRISSDPGADHGCAHQRASHEYRRCICLACAPNDPDRQPRNAEKSADEEHDREVVIFDVSIIQQGSLAHAGVVSRGAGVSQDRQAQAARDDLSAAEKSASVWI